MAIVQKYIKVSYGSPEELIGKLQDLGASAILTIRNTTPDHTDTKSWVGVWYEVKE